MRLVYLFLLLFVICSFSGCESSSDSDLKNGIWRGTLLRDGQQIPLLLDISKNPDGRTYKVFAINAGEKLLLDTAYFHNDSLHIPMELFDSEIIVKPEGDKLFGRYNRLLNKKVIAFLPIEASFGESFRFYKEGQASTTRNISGKWSTVFINPANGDSTLAVGNFDQKGTDVTGSFLTSTGDYRYLSGSMNGDSLFLSTFDADNAKLFKAVIQEDGSLSGSLWSGVKGFKTWTAKPDALAKLPDASKLTFIKPGSGKLDFSFPDANGNKVGLSDPRFKDKVVIIQILGSWCPNCMDETNFISPWIKKNRNRGVEVIGLAFEHSGDLAISGPRLTKMINRYAIDYPILLAGTNTPEATSKALPALNKIMSYPTTIIIDKKGNVRQIHTGFSGPGTGAYYEQFVEEFNGLIDRLVSEK